MDIYNNNIIDIVNEIIESKNLLRLELNDMTLEDLCCFLTEILLHIINKFKVKIFDLENENDFMVDKIKEYFKKINIKISIYDLFYEIIPENLNDYFYLEICDKIQIRQNLRFEELEFQNINSFTCLDYNIIYCNNIDSSCKKLEELKVKFKTKTKYFYITFKIIDE